MNLQPSSLYFSSRLKFRLFVWQEPWSDHRSDKLQHIVQPVLVPGLQSLLCGQSCFQLLYLAPPSSCTAWFVGGVSPCCCVCSPAQLLKCIVCGRGFFLLQCLWPRLTVAMHGLWAEFLPSDIVCGPAHRWFVSGVSSQCSHVCWAACELSSGCPSLNTWRCSCPCCLTTVRIQKSHESQYLSSESHYKRPSNESSWGELLSSDLRDTPPPLPEPDGLLPAGLENPNILCIFIWLHVVICVRNSTCLNQSFFLLFTNRNMKHRFIVSAHSTLSTMWAEISRSGVEICFSSVL